MRCFVTGIGGFAGSHLAAHLIARGHVVGGAITGRSDTPALRAIDVRDADLTLIEADVTDPSAVQHALAAFAPDAVFHLAGVAYVPHAGANAAHTFAVNAVGTMNVLEAVQRVAPRSRVLVVASSEVYGASAPDALPIGEDAPLRPVSVYGLSKAAADMAAFQEFWSTDLAVVRVRPFNHTGPGQSPTFVCSDFARQVARIEIGAAPPVLRVGSLGVVRDFSDVRDVVRGYALLCAGGVAGEVYNLCSGVGTSVARIVEILTAASATQIEIVEERGRVRRREIPEIVGSADRAAALGWSPEIPLDRTLRDLLAYWRRRVADERQ